MIPNKRVVVYTRVSSGDQHPENQLLQLRKYAETLGLKIVREYVDYASGGSKDRKEFHLMLSHSDQGHFDLLLLWSLDRFSREGISNTLAYLQRLKNNNVAVKSLKDTWLDTRDQGIAQLLLAIMSWVAEQERKRISERVRAGLQRAKSQGKKLGRPKQSKDKSPRSKSGYWLRYRGKSKEERKLKRSMR